MRLGYLNCNLDSGEGSVGFSPKFKSKSAFARRDMLKDWIERLTFEYEQASEEHRQQYEKNRESISIKV